MRLIDADELKVYHGINVGANYGGLRAIVFKRDIDIAQTIDAVPVVRCKDCIWFQNNHVCRLVSMFGTIERDPEDYCSRGERRDD